MSKIAISEAHIGIAAGAISQAYVRLRGAQKADINVHHAHTDIARVTLTWGRILFTFFNGLSRTRCPRRLLGRPPQPGRPASRHRAA